MKRNLILATALSSLVALSACGPDQTERRVEARRVSPPAREIPMIDTTAAVDYAANIDFITGGVGEDERAEIEAAKSRYNVHVTQARTDGAFVEDVKTIVKRKVGAEWQEVLSINSGPLLYIQLEPGTYVIESTRAGRDAKKQQFTIGAATKSKPISFTWKPLTTVAPADAQ